MEAMQHLETIRADYEKKAQEYKRQVDNESHQQILDARARESRLYDH